MGLETEEGVSQKRRVALILVDGIGDVAIPSLGFLTPLQAAHTPNLDAMARAGVSGLMDPVELGLACGSDIAHLSLLGYDPRVYYRCRGAFESMGAGLAMSPEDIAFKNGIFEGTLLHSVFPVLASWRVLSILASVLLTGESSKSQFVILFEDVVDLENLKPSVFSGWNVASQVFPSPMYVTGLADDSPKENRLNTTSFLMANCQADLGQKVSFIWNITCGNPCLEVLGVIWKNIAHYPFSGKLQ